MAKFYTGVGSRETPADVLALMEAAARMLAASGWVLRSGHAQGADRAFEAGAGGRAEVYVPSPAFGVRPYKDDPGMPIAGERVLLPREELLAQYDWLQGLGLRSQYRPDEFVRLLHGRNVNQVLGREPLTAPLPSRFVIAYAREDARGNPQGGTATAINLARHCKVEVFNLFRPEARARVEAWVNGPAAG